MREIHNFVLTWPDSVFKLQAASAIARHAPDEIRRNVEQEAIEVAIRIGEKEKGWPAINALTALLPWISDEQRSGITCRALDAVRTAALWVPAELAPYISESAMGDALELVRTLSHTAAIKRNALDALVPHLPQDLLKTSLYIAQSIDDGEDRVRAMAALAPAISERMMRVCLEKAGRPASLKAAADVISEIAAYLPTELLPDALELARQAGSATAIGNLAGRVPEPTRTTLWREALAPVFAEADAYLLENLVAELPMPFIIETAETLNAARRQGTCILSG